MLNPRFSSLLLLSLYSTSILASNDWSKPCFNGICSYDLPDTPSGPSGTLKIWGSNTAIADITTAGGWEIIGCDPDKEEQDIKIVCKGIDVDVVRIGDDDDQRANGKIVRLPPECGKQAFGRIANTWTHTDQTLPPSISKRLNLPLHRRTKHHHKIKGLTIDTQFQKTDRSKFGDVKFAIVGANVPGAKASEDLNVNELGERKRNFVYSRVFRHRRGFGDFIDDVGGAISDGVGAVGEVISDGAGAVGGAISDGVDAVGEVISDEISKTFSAPFDISKTFTVFEQNIKCSAPITNTNTSFNPKVGVNGKLKVDVEADVHGNVDISIFASGSLTELKLDKFELSTSLNADLNGAIILSAGVGGSIESGNIKLFEVGIPGLDFPGQSNRIFSIGPTFQINANAKASLNIDTDMRIGVAYHIDNAKFDFPNGGKKSGSFSAGDTPLQISAQPSSSATGTVEAHLIPSLNVGIDAFGGVAKAGVFVNLDASASVSLTVDATGPVVEGKVNRREMMVRGGGAMGAYYFNDKRTPTGGATDDVSFGGCVEVGAGLSVNVGADANFFGLFDPFKKIPLFEKQFSLLKKCFGEQKRRDLSVVGRGLTCNGVNVSGVVELVNEVVQSRV
ncbi:hypothetical protein AGABI1DRAFT_76923 [Agaricus bisporus var. burnettii JB137-S8]|uniref:SRCR domain-containing protein n=1 Tax=Agaricus bisporus var. burnettii (strain JB137-S8 / ATCC MYA-4627 / FGSC 10392) TaxID=597362 RepID=K5X2S8_AGABU|nr:uncharacterized protein AGABI1DRAFT_76923 [Agaricus bisporus var. burnettii JB137-S8]EKM77468.1 hypothetical protein AGABI1DRAFT_76923 [Agaricus bisporus var. burnettii JB137-S8]